MAGRRSRKRPVFPPWVVLIPADEKKPGIFFNAGLLDLTQHDRRPGLRKTPGVADRPLVAARSSHRNGWTTLQWKNPLLHRPHPEEPLMRSLIVALAVMLLTCGSVHGAERPNILWLVAEDFGPHLGCYGTQEVHTPRLDELARQGQRYTRFFTAAPVCSPSRSAFMTGMYQTTIGAHNHRSHRDDGHRLPEGVRVLTDWLRDAGYFTANVRQFPEELALKGSGKTDWNFTYDGKPFDSDQWTDLKSHQPFYAQVNFQETHRKFHAPPHADPAKVVLPPYYPDHPVVRADWAQYLDAATELDRKIGQVLDRLTADGLAENTVLVVFGDNGQAHVRGKQFCYDSGLNVPLIVKWPAKFAPPAGYAPGTVTDRLVSSIDLAPTMLTIAGASLPPKMQGQAFLGSHTPSPRQYVFGARDRCDETVARFRTVRDARYRYIRNFYPERPFLQPNDYKERSYPVWNLLKELDAAGQLNPVQKFLTAQSMPAEELYDLESDPHETVNLATSAEHQATLARLRSVLNEWIETSQDQGRVPEPPEVAAAEGATKPASAKKKQRKAQ
jgi:N-sulfoglucosamine sulfohydrolase